MYNTIAFIPVRGGSKSIKDKNIKLLNNRPLIYWSLDAVTKNKNIDKVYVCTDSEKIRNVVENYGDDKVEVIDRSVESATDTASTEFVMLEFAEKYEFENIILVQATSPLIKSCYIDEGVELIKNGYDSVLSVVEQKRFIWKNENGVAIPTNYEPKNRLRRQEFEGYYVENGSFYITNKRDLLNNKCRLNGKIGIVKMPEYTYFEIDEVHDFTIVEQIMKIEYTDNDKFEIFKNIKALIVDCDGVLTDCSMYYTENGDEVKKYNAKDGMAFKLLREAGIFTAIITGEDRELIKRRADKLKVDELFMGIDNKIEILNEIIDKYNFNYDEIAYIGDDINDLEVMKKVGLSCSVSDAMDIVKEKSDYVTKLKGGRGAVREVADLILSNRE